MKEKLHRKLLVKAQKLREIASGIDTISIVGTVFTELRKNSFKGEKSELHSPAKQCSYLLGVMLSTRDPIKGNRLDKKTVEKIIKLLNSIFDVYGLMYFQFDEDKKELGKEWDRYTKVSMPAFLHYFNTSIIASVEQIKKRIQLYITPLDNLVEAILGLSSEKMLEFTSAIANIQQEKLNALIELSEKEGKLRHSLLEKAELEGWTIERLREETSRSEYGSLVPIFLERIDSLFEVEISNFPTTTDKTLLAKYINIFSIQRGEVEPFVYITETNPAERFPLIEHKADKYLYPSINALYIAILDRLEDSLESSIHKDKYYKLRDKTLEMEVLNTFKKYFGDKASYYHELFETPDLNIEHDCIVVTQNCVFIIEVKASPPTVPFRDPEKAFIRLKRQFESDRGIQKAFEQANRLRTKLVNHKELPLYDKNGEQVLFLRADQNHQVFCVCVTRDNFGPLGTNLNLLLVKDADIPYPLAINIFDLESLLNGFKHLGFGESELSNYIAQRSQLHGKVFGTDELEFAGFYIKHNGFEKLINLEADLVNLLSDYSDIFDEIYVAEASGEKVTYDVTEPYLRNYSQDLIDYFSKKDSEKIKKDKRRREKKREQIAKLSRRKNRRK